MLQSIIKTRELEDKSNGDTQESEGHPGRWHHTSAAAAEARGQMEDGEHSSDVSEVMHE